jgi:diguanylate cyclase (GGDEF)-like protein
LEESQYYYIPDLEIKITASFGVVTFEEDTNSFEELINKVDKYLYFAKAQGRNKVCSSLTEVT